MLCPPFFVRPACLGMAAAVLLSAAACRKSRKDTEASSPSEVVPVVAPVPVATPTGAAAAAAPSAPATEDAVTKFRNSSEFADLSKAYQVFYLQQKRHTTDLQDLVRAKYLRAIPPAPPGKSYAVDQKNLKVILIP